jgi:hypothetical protein
MSTLAITGEVFRWAIERAGISDEKLLYVCILIPKKLLLGDWLKNIKFPTRSVISHCTDIPLVIFSYLIHLKLLYRYADSDFADKPSTTIFKIFRTYWMMRFVKEIGT